MVLPAALAVVVAAVVVPTADNDGRFALLYFSPLVVALACLLTGYVVSVRPIRAAILGGRAPAWVTSPDRRWWWDGTYWFGVSAVAPPSALRSPDGNYWWTGDGWSPLPALPPRKPRG
jgi:hypothetical protein